MGNSIKRERLIDGGKRKGGKNFTPERIYIYIFIYCNLKCILY